MVTSRKNGDFRWTVDMENRAGLGKCNCPDFEKNKNPDCWHLVQVRKFVATVAIQSIIYKYGIR